MVADLVIKLTMIVSLAGKGSGYKLKLNLWKKSTYNFPVDIEAKMPKMHVAINTYMRVNRS